MKKLFVDKNINIFKGKEASKLLAGKNDKEFIQAGIVKKVSLERWKEAQDYERNTWCFSEARGMITDRNEDHMKNFGGYRQLNIFLSTEEIKMIELGCGPFTNLRLIIPELFKTIDQVDLLDPLINDYVQHTINCPFKLGYLVSRKVNKINSSIENFQTDQQYDLIVMINVLEHCRDIDLVFKKIQDMMHDYSIFLFHVVAIEDGKVEEIISNKWDCGHPIILTKSYLKEIISKFRIIYKKENLNSKNEETTYYYILKKK